MNRKRVEHKYENNVELKYCGKCQQWKSLTKFHRNISKWDGLSYRCKKCANKNESGILHIEHKFDNNGCELKYCYTCQQWKILKEFHKNMRKWDGLQYECKECRNKSHREKYANSGQSYRDKICNTTSLYQKQHPEQRKIIRRKHVHGITRNEMDMLYLQQSGLCAICHLPLEYNKMDIDHSHQLDMVRGLCHRGCNIVIGKFEDNIDLLKRAINYLVEDYQTSNDVSRIFYTHSVNMRKKYLKSLLESQEYKCPICQRDIAIFKSVVDHNHATNLMRSALCTRCNTGLGIFNEDIGFIGQAIQYLIDAEYKILMRGGVIEKSI